MPYRLPAKQQLPRRRIRTATPCCEAQEAAEGPWTPSDMGLEALGIVVALCAVPAALGADYGTNSSELHLKVVAPCMEDSTEQLHAWPAVL